MARLSLTPQDIRNLKRRKCTSNKAEFAAMRTLFPDRPNIVSEGDSWFAYPKKWIVKGKPANLIDHITRWTKGKANFLSMASNGDEAVDMISGKQKHELINLVKWHTKGPNRKPLDLILFSGGGNDIVGKNDFERFLKSSQNHNSADLFVNKDRLTRKSRQIGLAYEELADIRDHYSPATIIISHTYDYPFPSNTGGNFLGGLIKTKAWMKRFMDDPLIGVPEPLQAEVIRIFMDAIGDSLVQIGNRRSGLEIVDTRQTLMLKNHWLNEIHPDSKGFELLAEVIFTEMKHQLPELA